MDDLISRGALLEKSMCAGLCDALGDFYGCADVVLTDDVKAAPVVDAVEVVRCKDCKHYRTYSTFVVDCCRGHGMTYVNANDFCNYGERKENG